MHARCAFLTNLSCLQPFLLKRRYVRNVPPHLSLFSPPSLSSLSLHCIDKVEYFPCCGSVVAARKQKAAVPIHCRAERIVFLALRPQLPSYRCYLCLCHTRPLDCEAACNRVRTCFL